ncbi:MAG TPA: hypothetical protein VKU92_08730, partial [Acidimicrobiales bacterium]|nr:hypothetical protein [Acidimicrobiales bacterium]
MSGVVTLRLDVDVPPISHLAPWWGRPAGRENGVRLARDVDVFLATRPLISLAPGSDQKGRA